LVNEIDDISDGDIIEEEDEEYEEYDDNLNQIEESNPDSVKTAISNSNTTNNQPKTTSSNIKTNSNDLNDSWATIESDPNDRIIQTNTKDNRISAQEDNDEWLDCDESDDECEDISIEDDNDNDGNGKRKGKKVKFNTDHQQSKTNEDIHPININKPKSILKTSQSKIAEAKKVNNNQLNDHKTDLKNTESSIIENKNDLVKTVINETEYENKLKNSLDACYDYFDTPSDQLDLEFFNKVKSAHNEYKQIEAQEELKDLHEALLNKNKNERITDTKHNELDMSFREDTLLNKFITKKNSQ